MTKPKSSKTTEDFKQFFDKEIKFWKDQLRIHISERRDNKNRLEIRAILETLLKTKKYVCGK